MNAWELSAQQRAKISKYSGSSSSIQQRLEDLGFYAGETIECIKITPFKGPKVYQNSHGIFSIEQEIASLIEVEAL